MKYTLQLRAIVSLALVVMTIVEAFTGIGLYLAPSGRIARTTNWTFLGFPLFKLEMLHTYFGFAMTALIVVHFILNAGLFKNEIKILFRR